MNSINKFTSGIVFAVLSLSSLSAVGQVRDYRAINEDILKEKAKRESLVEAKKAQKSVDYYSVDGRLPPVMRSEKVRMFKPLLRCFEKFAQKRNGGSQSPDFILDMLGKLNQDAKLTQDPFLVQEVTQECKDGIKYLESDVEAKIKFDNYKGGAYRFLSALYYPEEYICLNRNVSLRAAAVFIGASVGAAGLKCLYSNGKVKRFANVSADLNVGIGAEIEYTKRQPTKVNTQTLLRVAPYMRDDYRTAAAIDIDGFRHEDPPGRRAIGLGIFQGAVGTELGVRIWNGKRRWQFLLRKFEKAVEEY